jgi:hypothetical protein
MYYIIVLSPCLDCKTCNDDGINTQRAIQDENAPLILLLHMHGSLQIWTLSVVTFNIAFAMTHPKKNVDAALFLQQHSCIISMYICLNLSTVFGQPFVCT